MNPPPEDLDAGRRSWHPGCLSCGLVVMAMITWLVLTLLEDRKLDSPPSFEAWQDRVAAREGIVLLAEERQHWYFAIVRVDETQGEFLYARNRNESDWGHGLSFNIKASYPDGTEEGAVTAGTVTTEGFWGEYDQGDVFELPKSGAREGAINEGEVVETIRNDPGPLDSPRRLTLRTAPPSAAPPPPPHPSPPCRPRACPWRTPSRCTPAPCACPAARTPAPGPAR